MKLQGAKDLIHLFCFGQQLNFLLKLCVHVCVRMCLYVCVCVRVCARVCMCNQWVIN